MANENRIGCAVDANGEIVMEVFSAPNALSNGADWLSQHLYMLSELIIRGVLPDQRGGGLGGEFGYGVDFENDVFMMHHFCWCEKERCLWCCGDEPNFRHKSTGFEVKWYKWIGRDMEIKPEDASNDLIFKVIKESFDSIPQDAKVKAKESYDYEHTPEFLAKKEEFQKRMWEVLSNPEKYDAPRPHVICAQCGKEEDLEPQWGTPMFWRCEKCLPSFKLRRK